MIKPALNSVDTQFEALLQDLTPRTAGLDGHHLHRYLHPRRLGDRREK